MGYQFGHVEAYGRLAGKKKKDGNTVSRILAEARREEGSCSHIENPQPHELVWGMTLDEVEARVEEWASQAKDARGHAIRKDALCMVGGVVSLPREQMEEDWEDFKTRAVKWLQNEYGNALLCVIAHLDEAHPHLHFYAVAKDGQRFDSIHEGYRAQNGLTGERGNRELSKNEKADIRARGKFAYAAAMRKWQDRLQEDVGKYYGLARIGPRRRRISSRLLKMRQFFVPLFFTDHIHDGIELAKGNPVLKHSDDCRSELPSPPVALMASVGSRRIMPLPPYYAYVPD